ncbi:hypothetical protein ABEF82_14785 [Acinetobacter thermotolerans]|uniref:hypothetical protein n=1 Tax=Acinetobacter thermotolerans TaxID=3151487 RepID=UPI00325A9BF4
MSNYKINVVDLVDEMLHRTDCMVYMLEALRSEINAFPELTGHEKVFFQSLEKCLNTVELLNYGNLEKLQVDAKCINAEQELTQREQIQVA